MEANQLFRVYYRVDGLGLEKWRPTIWETGCVCSSTANIMNMKRSPFTRVIDDSVDTVSTSPATITKFQINPHTFTLSKFYIHTKYQIRITTNKLQSKLVLKVLLLTSNFTSHRYNSIN